MKEQVLTLILRDGTTTGIVECSVDEWYGISYKIPRTKIKESSKLPYINNSGVYILFGDDENTANKVAYIGEAEDIYNRLEQHNRNKDFWNECVVFMSENNSLNKAHIKYIEHELYKLSKETNRLIIKNDSTPTKSTLGRADEIKSEKFIEKVKTITSMVGYRLFDNKVEKEDIKDYNILYLKNNGIEYAKGLLTDEGFVILKGSKIKSGIFDGISKSLIDYCNRERNSIDIEKEVFISDHLCSSPSMAGVIILGRNSNGYTEWKNKDGISLREILKKYEIV
ncbi:MAG: GIY-YIG nuclease family protein [Clostridia bacterium]